MMGFELTITIQERDLGGMRQCENVNLIWNSNGKRQMEY